VKFFFILHNGSVLIKRENAKTDFDVMPMIIN